MRWWIVVVALASVMGSAAGLAAGGPDDAFVERFDLPRDPESVLSEVLARREFAEDPVSRWIRGFRDRAAAVLAEIVRWIVSRLPSMGPVKLRGDILGTIGTALLVGVAGVVILAVGWRIALVIRRQIGKRDGTRGLSPAPDEVGTPAGLRLRALAEAERGNFGPAVIFFFRYVVLRLDEEGLIAYHHGKTNRELLAALTADETVRKRAAEMILVFNRVRYGRASCGRDDYERFVGLSSDVVGGL